MTVPQISYGSIIKVSGVKDRAEKDLIRKIRYE